MLTIENPNFWQWIVTLASICNSLMMMIWWYFRELCAITDLRPEARQTPPLQPPYQTGPPCKYNTNTLQIQYKYNTNTLLIWYKCNTDAAVTDPRIKVNCTTSSNLQLEAEDAALTALQITWPANNVLKICTSLWPALCYIATLLNGYIALCYIALFVWLISLQCILSCIILGSEFDRSQMQSAAICKKKWAVWVKKRLKSKKVGRLCRNSENWNWTFQSDVIPGKTLFTTSFLGKLFSLFIMLGSRL